MGDRGVRVDIRGKRSPALRPGDRLLSMRARCATALAAALALAAVAGAADAPAWSERDLRLLASLRLERPPPPSTSNRVADDPRAAALGRRIFFDREFGEAGATACATCHDPERHYTDGRARSAPAGRNTPSVVGGALAAGSPGTAGATRSGRRRSCRSRRPARSAAPGPAWCAGSPATRATAPTTRRSSDRSRPSC